MARRRFKNETIKGDREDLYGFEHFSLQGVEIYHRQE
jgi:hypothetical protein